MPLFKTIDPLISKATAINEQKNKIKKAKVASSLV